MCLSIRNGNKRSYFLWLLLLSGHMEGSIAVVWIKKRGCRLEGRIEMGYKEIERESYDFNPLENLLECFNIVCMERT